MFSNVGKSVSSLSHKLHVTQYTPQLETLLPKLLNIWRRVFNLLAPEFGI